MKPVFRTQDLPRGLSFGLGSGLIPGKISMWKSVIVLPILAMMALGCGAPQPPQKVNAYLPANVPLVGAGTEACATADAIVLGKCAQCREYATIVQGDWVNSWYVAQWRVLRVEQGQWPDRTISFVFVDKWPAPDSGIMVKKAPMPYHVGAVRAFCLDMKGQPTIVADQSRSRIPPYAPVTRPTYNVSDPQIVTFYERIANTAKAFVRRERSVTGPADVTEQYGRLYVVEIETVSDSLAVVVDGDTWAVQWADPADAMK
jgi:hypothetical protein